MKSSGGEQRERGSSSLQIYSYLYTAERKPAPTPGFKLKRGKLIQSSKFIGWKSSRHKRASSPYRGAKLLGWINTFLSSTQCSAIPAKLPRLSTYSFPSDFCCPAARDSPFSSAAKPLLIIIRIFPFLLSRFRIIPTVSSTMIPDPK